LRDPLHAESDFAAAENLAQLIIKSRPPTDENVIRAHNLKGLLIARDPLKSEKAIEEFRTAIRLDPKFAAPHYNLVNLLRGQGKFDELKNEYDILTRLDPDLAKQLQDGTGSGIAEGGDEAGDGRARNQRAQAFRSHASWPSHRRSSAIGVRDRVGALRGGWHDAVFPIARRGPLRSIGDEAGVTPARLGADKRLAANGGSS
jgi:tetratricopeptide (TPR) repeat protein